jgi:hypothetical protein
MTVLFSLLKGDPVLPLLRDAARWAREHDKRAVLIIGTRNYEIHPDHTDNDALYWLLDKMVENGDVVRPENAGRRGALPIRGAP